MPFPCSLPGAKPRAIADEHRARANPWANKLGEIVDATFFEDLQTELEAEENQRPALRRRWLMNGKDGVIDHANNILSDAENSLPCPSIQRFRAKTSAEGAFRGWLRGNNGIPELFRPSAGEEEEDTECQNNDRPPGTENSTETQTTLFE